MSSDERRGDQRYDKVVPVRLQFAGAEDFLRAYTENISLGGVFVPTNVMVPIGTAVALTIELAAGRGMQIMSEVAWHRPEGGGEACGVGLRFTKMKDNHRAWLAEAVQKYSDEHAPKEESLRPEHQLRKAVGPGELVGASLPLAEVQLSSTGADDIVIGIDLGTSNSCACVFRDGRAEILELDDFGPVPTRTVPSVVAYGDGGTVTVGQRALEGISRNAKRTVYGAKRFIGRQYDHPDVQGMLSHYPYKVVPGPGGKVAVEIDGRSISLTSVSAKILAYIRDRAEKALNGKVTRAIITVPAFYNQNQRHAVTQAARLAGLTVERVLNEPTAAAIAYGLNEQTARTILVYDLGGGTFDVSVMTISSQKLDVRATAGDTFLGGEDFDNVIVAWVADQVHSRTKKHLSRNHAAIAPVRLAAEKAKRRLTVHERTMVTVRDAMMTDGSTHRLEMEIERDRVEVLVEPLVQRTLKICDMALEQARMHRADVDDVVLVGGQTLMPMVQRRVTEHFGKTPVYNLKADEVVALGAGMLTELNRTAEDAPELGDVLSMSIGVGLGGGRFKALIERNTKLPARVSHKISVPKSQLATYKLEIYQGEAPEVQRNEHLGTLTVADLPAGTRDPVALAIDLILSPDCLLKVRVTNTETDDDVDILLDTRDT